MSNKDQIFSRRKALKLGLCGAAASTCVWDGFLKELRAGWFGNEDALGVFKGGAPKGKLWENWKRQGWIREVIHFNKIGKNYQCQTCPNMCLLEPGDRGKCRTKIHQDGKLYSIAYGNPCSVNLDPIEKKPLYHFVPQSKILSIATAGCGFRCLNCQNWEISQANPEDTKNPYGEKVRYNSKVGRGSSKLNPRNFSMFPADVVDVTLAQSVPSIAYTYTEPAVWFEYMYETAKLAKKAKVKNVWVTCGYIREKPLRELCKYIDGVNVDLKSFSKETYRKLNSGKLDSILTTLKTLKEQRVWFEITNLIVPTYTDKPDMIRRMCDWIVKNLGPDYPIHFSRFHPAHKLTHLSSTPVKVLLNAREIARKAGLHYVYIGNVAGVKDAGTTFCPKCRKAVIERTGYSVHTNLVKNGKCSYCGEKIAGVWV